MIDRFNEAFNSHDVDAIMALMTDDVIFDNTTPPDGERFEGQDAVRGFWEAFFGGEPERVVRHRRHVRCGGSLHRRGGCSPSTRANPDEGHIRGVDVFKVRDGKVAEKLSLREGVEA